MLHVKNPNQSEMFDPWRHLGDKVYNRLHSSWAGLFRGHVLPRLPVSEFAKSFNSTFGRPTKELHIGLGVTLLQQIHDLTDEETADALAFNMLWHYALNILGNSDTYTHMCPKTIYNIRKTVMESGLDYVIFDRIRDELLQLFDVDTDKQRLDSKHIKSNMARLGRVGIFSKTICKFLKNLKKSHKSEFERLQSDMPDIKDRYLGKKSMQCFSMVKPSKAAGTLAELSNDLLKLNDIFKDNKDISAMHSFKLLARVLNEHCEIEEKEGGSEAGLKKPKDIPSDSLQNPSDPDASYSGHKGQGYQVQVLETFQDDKKETVPNIINYVEVEPAHNSDANALIPAIEKTSEAGICPKELQADSLYGGDENREKALEFGVEVVSPVMGSTKGEKIGFAEFEISENADITACPEGQKPASIKINKKSRCAVFESKNCDNCPKSEECPANKCLDGHHVRYAEKEMRVAICRQYEQTDEFRERYRMRAGVEATMSQYDRQTGVGRLRVRGLPAVRLCAVLKAAGINIFRAVAAKAAQLREKRDENRGQNPLRDTFFVFKEQIGTFLGKIKQIFRPKLIFTPI